MARLARASFLRRRMCDHDRNTLGAFRNKFPSAQREIPWRTEVAGRAWSTDAEYQTLNGMAASGASYTLPTMSDGAGCVDDTWTATSTSNAPSARAGHTAVWTGSEMIVWGGGDGPNVFNTGGKYCAATQSPTPTATPTATANTTPTPIAITHRDRHRFRDPGLPQHRAHSGGPRK